jgi:glycosyltransferase involved in cell wall biosynthesis
MSPAERAHRDGVRTHAEQYLVKCPIKRMGTAFDYHRPIRIAHVALQFDMGGMEKLLIEFARHTDRQRHALHFVSLTTRGKLLEEIEAHGWPTIALGEGSGLRPRLVFRLQQLFQQWKIDVLHTHNEASLIYGAPGAWLAGIQGIIQTRHGRAFGVNRRRLTLYRLASLLADRVICVSQDTAKLSARQGILRLSRVWNGIDLNQFFYTGPRADGPAVLVARLSPEKDVPTLLRAAAIVAKDLPSFRVVVAGDGSCLADLQRLAGELAVNQNVRFLGEVRHVAALLENARLFVLPSLSEGISLTLLEAMARGLPVVATRVGGNPEVVKDGETGLLVPPGSPEELAAAMRQLYVNPERGRRMGLAGRQRVEQHFDVRRMVATYESIYRQLVNPKMLRSRNGIGAFERTENGRLPVLCSISNLL